MPIYFCPRQKIRILFVHVPKCGGGSIEKFFRDNGFVEDLFLIDSRLAHYCCSPQHWHRDLLLKVVKMSSIDYIFTIVRDPVDRLVSEYKWRIKHPSTSKGFDSWYQHSRIMYDSDPFVFDNHLRPQVEFILPGCDVYRFSSGLQNIVDHISLKLGITFDIPDIANQKEGAHFKRVGFDPSLLQRLSQSSPSSQSIQCIRVDYNDDFQLIRRFYDGQLFVKSD